MDEELRSKLERAILDDSRVVAGFRQVRLAEVLREHAEECRGFALEASEHSKDRDYWMSRANVARALYERGT